MEYANLSLAKNSVLMKQLTVRELLIRTSDKKELKETVDFYEQKQEAKPILKTPFSIPAGEVLSFSKIIFGNLKPIKYFKIVIEDPNNLKDPIKQYEG